jgi:asparagine synthase (glutamine-hydrolysing)
MSCICGIVHFDGRPVARDLLARMSATMRSSAPDGETIEVRGSVGFAHNLLQIDKKTTRRLPAKQSHANRILVADARIDARADFLRQLVASGCFADSSATDADLLLQAYEAYGEDSLKRLIGDFAFALWDDAKQTLLLARDQFGARPIFYAEIKDGIVFASQIRALLAHPEVSNEQDEIAVGDFLMFGHYQDESRTIFRQIKRLEPASTQVTTRSSSVVERYWKPSFQSRISYSRVEEYGDHFAELLEKAVLDRVEGDIVASEMSGGKDSTSIVAVAAGAAKSRGFDLRTFTMTCNRMFPEDQEGHYAEIAAKFLDVSNEQWAIEDFGLPDWSAYVFADRDEPFISLDREFEGAIASRMCASGAKVLLSGVGGDLMFAGPTPIPTFRRGVRRFARSCNDLLRYRLRHGTLRGLGLRAALPNRLRDKGWSPGDLPPWIEPAFVARANLTERWHRYWRIEADSISMEQQFARPWFSAHLNGAADHTPPIQVRFPFYDARIVQFCASLSLDTVHEKGPLVAAMQQKLPNEILRRPKASLAGDVIHARSQNHRRMVELTEKRRSTFEEFVNFELYLLQYDRFGKSPPPASTSVSLYSTAPMCYLRWWERS